MSELPLGCSLNLSLLGFEFLQDMELSETKRAEQSLKEEKGDSELEIKTLKRWTFFLCFVYFFSLNSDLTFDRCF